MNKWPGKYIIGLTGNIGTGKSVIRRMLEHLGAYGIDADALAHRAYAKGAPGYDRVLEVFGSYILNEDEQIDRKKLGRIVFNDPQAMKQLEAIVHPLVAQAIDLIIRRSNQKVIVLESARLVGTPMAEFFNTLWVVYAPEEIQLSRLMLNRGMTEKDARQRINAQQPQEAQLGAANVIIKNVSSYEDAWKQVTAAWKKYVSTSETPVTVASEPVHLSLGEVVVKRAGPKQVNDIIDVSNRLLHLSQPLLKEQVMAAFGEKAYLLLQVEQSYLGILAWQVENLVARTKEIALDPVLPPAQYIPIMIREMERASTDLQCEISLVSVPVSLAQHEALWKSLGYTICQPAELTVLAWQEAAQECNQKGSVLFFKQLRMDRVLRPI